VTPEAKQAKDERDGRAPTAYAYSPPTEPIRCGETNSANGGKRQVFTNLSDAEANHLRQEAQTLQLLRRSAAPFSA
jgi:hypothetical protein